MEVLTDSSNAPKIYIYILYKYETPKYYCNRFFPSLDLSGSWMQCANNPGSMEGIGSSPSTSTAAFGYVCSGGGQCGRYGWRFTGKVDGMIPDTKSNID